MRRIPFIKLKPGIVLNGLMKGFTTANKLALLFIACLSSAFAAQTTEESKVLLNQLMQQIKVTMTAVANAEQQAGNRIQDLNLTLDIPANVSPNLGLVLDVENPQGFKVLSVSPGSMADALSIAPNAVITSINGKQIGNDSRNLVFAELENLTAGDKMSLEILDNGQLEKLNTTVNGQYTPAVQLSIMGSELATTNNDVEVSDSTEQSNTCGLVSVFNKPPVTRDLFPVKVTQIGDDGVNIQRVKFKLPVGKHTIHIQEFINDAFFKRRSFSIQDAKTLEIDVEPNTTYHLAAKFNRRDRNKQKGGEYWEPVIWKTQGDRSCEL